MERQSPPKILQLKKKYVARYLFVLSMRQGVPRGVLGDYPLLSMKDEYHAYDYVATLAFFVRHRVRPAGPGTRRLKLYLKFYLQPEK